MKTETERDTVSEKGTIWHSERGRNHSWGGGTLGQGAYLEQGGLEFKGDGEYAGEEISQGEVDDEHRCYVTCPGNMSLIRIGEGNTVTV